MNVNAEIENDATEGSPTLTIDRLIEEGDSVVAVGGGSVGKKGGGSLSIRRATCGWRITG